MSRTRYTKCWYCGKSFPLREIVAHVKAQHREESTKYTNCTKCGGKIALNLIRSHARTCTGKAPEDCTARHCADHSTHVPRGVVFR